MLRRPLIMSLLCLLLLAPPASAVETARDAGDAPTAAGHPLGPPRSARYIVQLSEPPLALYDGDLPGLDATAIGADAREAREDEPSDAGVVTDGRARLDLGSPAALAYRQHLRAGQERLATAIAAIAPDSAAQYHYTTLLNGIALRLTEAQAAEVARLPGVLAVTEEERIELRMDAANPLVGAPAAWLDPRIGSPGEAGRGVRIAIVDSGIAADHPMFDDTGFTAPEGYPQASITIGDERQPYGPAELGRFTNAKVIASRYYVNPEAHAASPDRPRDPLPMSAHGTHVAGIAAGLPVIGGPNLHGRGEIAFSGLAPAAWLMAYRFDEAYTPEIVRAIEDAVADGADVINNSWGTALMNVVSPETHPVAQAFKAAAAANVVVVAAAGNSGAMGPASLGGPHQMIDEVITVGNSQTGRSLHYYVRAEDEGLPEPLRAHEGLYIDNGPSGPAWDEMRAPARISDACADEAGELAGKILLVDFLLECPDYSPELPSGVDPALAEALPDFFKQTLAAEEAGAQAVVFYLGDGDPFVLLILVLWELLRGLIEGVELLEPAPAFLILGEEAGALVAWSETHPTLEILLDITPESQTDPAAVDMAAPSTSQGPTPADPRLPLKPDLSAPGTDILSANAVGGRGAGYMLATGTSMSSPAVAGAAALLRQARPDWSPAEVKAALMGSSQPQVKEANDPQQLAPVTTQGAGRLRVDRALDPGVLLDPPSLNLGLRRAGEARFEVRVRDARPATDGAEAQSFALLHVPGQLGASGPKPSLPEDALLVPAGGEAQLDLSFDLEGLPGGAYDGWVVLSNDEHSVHLPYALQVPGEPKDVLLINVLASYEAPDPESFPQLVDREDRSRYWVEALDKAELSHEVWTVAVDEEGQITEAHDGMPPLSELQRFELVIVAGGEGNVPLEGMVRGMTPLQMYLLGGGAMLGSGPGWPHAPRSVGGAGAQSAGAMFMLGRYFAGFEVLEDDIVHTGPFEPVRPFETAPFPPVGLFDKPVRLEQGWEPAAASDGRVDLGRPLARLVTWSRDPAVTPPDNPFSTPAERIMPYARGYLELDRGRYVMTGVTADATLENPVVSPDIPWRAMLASFPIEAVGGDPRTSLTRAELLEQVFAWATEPNHRRLTVTANDWDRPVFRVGQRVRFIVGGQQARSGTAAYRWDAGEGEPFFSTSIPSTELVFRRPGLHRVRVEALSHAGRTRVAETQVMILPASDPPAIHLPMLLRGQTLDR